MNPKINEIVATLREYAPDADGTQRYILIPAAGRGATAEYPVTVRSRRTDIMRDAADLIEQLQQELIDERYRHDRLQDWDIARTREQPRWIPVTERLPEDDDDVLIMPRNANCVNVGYFNVNSKAWYDYVGMVPADITHWMPLPEAPKEEQHESERVPQGN